MAVHGVEHDIAEILDGRQAAVETNIEHALARGDFTGRQLDVVPLDRRFDIADRQVVRGQRAAVDPDADGVAAVAPDGHAGYAVQGRQPVDEIALDEIGNLLRRLPVGGDGEPHHRVRIAVVLDDARLVGAVGQTGANAADGVAHVVRRLVDVAADFESDDGPAAPAASTSGRSRTGIENNDAIPETTISALATIARTGRRIDRSDRVIPRPPRHWRFRALAAPSLRLVYRAAHRTPATSPPARHGPPACLRAPLHPARTTSMPGSMPEMISTTPNARLPTVTVRRSARSSSPCLTMANTKAVRRRRRGPLREPPARARRPARRSGA